MTKTVVFVILLANASPSSAQMPLSLPQAIAEAIARRPELRSAALRVEAAEHIVRQSRALPNPRLFVQSENLQPSNFNYGRDADTFAYMAQPIDTSGRRAAQARLAAAEVQDRSIDRDLVRRDMVARVRQAYWDALGAQVTTALYVESESYLDEMVAYHDARLKEGKLAEVDLLRVQLQEAQIEALAAAARLQVEKSLLVLAREMGMSQPGQWQLTEDFSQFETPGRVTGDSQAPPALRQARQDVAIAAAREQLERAKGRPDLDAIFGLKRTGGRNTAMAGLQLNVPLFDHNRDGAAAASFERDATQSTLAAVEIQVTNDIALARREYDMRLQQARDVFVPLRDRATEIATITRAAYREGGLELLRLLDAERLRIDAQLAWVDAMAHFHRSVIELERAEGVQP